jgi:hypothetical protein
MSAQVTSVRDANPDDLVPLVPPEPRGFSFMPTLPYLVVGLVP